MFFRALSCACLLLLACESDAATASSKADGSKPATSPDPEPSKPALPSVDAGAAKQAVEALEAAAPNQKPVIAAAALAELEAKRLPPSLIEGLEAISQAPPDQRAMLLAKSISTNIALLDQACGTDARKLMGSMATMAPATRDDVVWSKCNLLPHGLMQESDRATSDPLLAMVAHMVLMHLESGGGASDDEKTLMKMMMKRTEPATP